MKWPAGSQHEPKHSHSFSCIRIRANTNQTVGQGGDHGRSTEGGGAAKLGGKAGTVVPFLFKERHSDDALLLHLPACPRASNRSRGADCDRLSLCSRSSSLSSDCESMWLTGLTDSPIILSPPAPSFGVVECRLPAQPLTPAGHLGSLMRPRRRSPPCLERTVSGRRGEGKARERRRALSLPSTIAHCKPFHHCRSGPFTMMTRPPHSTPRRRPPDTTTVTRPGRARRWQLGS